MNLKEKLKKFKKYFIDGFMKSGFSNKKGISEEDVDPEQLKMGIEVEYEHTIFRSIAKKIALDHLAEIPDYYTRLKKMEEQAKKEGKLKK